RSAQVFRRDRSGPWEGRERVLMFRRSSLIPLSGVQSRRCARRRRRGGGRRRRQRTHGSSAQVNRNEEVRHGVERERERERESGKALNAEGAEKIRRDNREEPLTAKDAKKEPLRRKEKQRRVKNQAGLVAAPAGGEKNRVIG